MKNSIKVSILCLTYNQEKYIEQALDSILNQKTNFKFEVLINDDASTDKTVKIIKEYQKKYPEIIKPIFQKENLYSKGKRNFFSKILLPLAKGEYISLCEGDDFFTDKNKLQIETDFLDINPRYSLCFHPVKVFFENHENDDFIFPDPNQNITFNLSELLKWNYIQTNSVMYRRQEYGSISNKNIMPGDWYLHLYHAKFGKIGFINKIMSAYRRHSKGIWWDSYKDTDKLLLNNGIMQLTLFIELIKLFPQKKYKEIITRHIDILIKKMISVDKKYKSKLVKSSFNIFPSELIDHIISVYQIIDLSNANITENALNELKTELSQLKEEKYSLLNDLTKIQSSKTYRTWQNFNKIKKFVLGKYEK